MAAERCAGCPYNTLAVGPRGPEDSEVCVVGEAPGTEELHTGVPFVGQSGKLLSKVLARAGIDMETVFITNALRCRPPIGEAPPRQVLEACRTRLIEEVTRHPRKLVIALGNSSLRSLTRQYDSKITQERGRPRRIGLVYEDEHTIRNQVVLTFPTYHPAYILRNMGEYKKLSEDIAEAGRLARGAAPREPGLVEWYLASGKGIGEWLDFLSGQPVLALDIETGTKDPIPGGAFSPRLGEILCLGVRWQKNQGVVFPGRLLEKYPKRFARFFSSPATFVWHNGKFDTQFLEHLGARCDEDTMLIHYVLSEGVREEHGLEALAEDYLGAPPEWKNMIKKHLKKKDINLHGYYHAPREVLYEYNAVDCDMTGQLYEEFVPKLNRSPELNYVYEHILMPASNFLRRVEGHGIWVDQPTLVNLRRELNDEMSQAQAIMRQESGMQYINPNAPAQVLQALRQEGHNVRDTRKETIKDLEQTPFTTALTAYRQAAKMLGTYVDGVQERIEPDGRVHSTFLIHGTATGRLSSRNPNMQNVPRSSRIRNIFQAPPGKVLVELDYSQAELRVLAVLSGDEGLRDVYESGRDLHDEVARSLFGDNFTKEQRVRAKFVNFGIAYGRGADSLVQEFKMSYEMAKRMIAGWWRTFPAAHRYVKGCRASIHRGYLESPFGRRRRFGLIPSNKVLINALENEAANFPIQSTASDLTLLAAMSMQPQLVERWDAHIINLVHDSILIECEPAEADEVGAYAREIMECTPEVELDWHFPFQAEYKVAQRWGDLK